MKRLTVLVAAIFLAGATAAVADSIINLNGGPLSLTFTGETGFVKVLSHEITIGDVGAGNTTLDYVNEGGQEILFPFNRITAELGISDRHTVIFLYQPLNIETQVRFDEDRTIDGETFLAGEGVNLTYGFPFYRVSYLFDFFRQENIELAAGASLQLRNATLRFESTNGETITVTQDLGPVPILKLRGEYQFVNSAIPGAFVGLEADGFYASSAFFNGAEYEFTGSVLDASLRAGFQPMPGLDVFLNLRGFGGGANGTRPASDPTFWTQSQSGITDNFLTSMSITLGARLR